MAERWHWSYSDFISMPIPAFFIFADEFMKICKKEEKAHKKASRRRR